MSDPFEDRSDAAPDASHAGSAEESTASSEALPPVKPPSAGFIVQLFLVPGLIVLAVVAVWALFGKLAAGERDWQAVVAELRSDNAHRRWPAAHSLAQMLQSGDETEGGERLAENPVLVGELTGLFAERLDAPSQSEDDLKFQAFLARALGLLDAPEEVVPVLREAMQKGHDREVRKNAIASVAVIAARSSERGERLDAPLLVDDLVDVSSETDPLVRQLGAYTLGLIPSDASRARLTVMLDDPEKNTRANAAVGLARQDSTAGIDVFKAVLSEAGRPLETGSVTASDDVERRRKINNLEYQRDLRLKNTLDAVGRLAGQFTPQQRDELVALLEGVADAYRRQDFRVKAEAVIQALRRGG